MKNIYKFVMSGALCTIILTGCSDNPETVVDNFIYGMASGDYAKVTKTVLKVNKESLDTEIIKSCNRNIIKALEGSLSFNKKASANDELFIDIQSKLIDNKIILSANMSEENKEKASILCFPAILKSEGVDITNPKPKIKVISSSIENDKATVKVQKLTPDASELNINLIKVDGNWVLSNFRQLIN